MNKKTAQNLDLVSLIGKQVDFQDRSGFGAIVGVRIDHNKEVHIEGKWESFGKVQRYWKRLHDPNIMIGEMCEKE